MGVLKNFKVTSLCEFFTESSDIKRRLEFFQKVSRRSLRITHARCCHGSWVLRRRQQNMNFISWFKIFPHLIWIEFHSLMGQKETWGQMQMDGSLGDGFYFGVLLDLRNKINLFIYHTIQIIWHTINCHLNSLRICCDLNWCCRNNYRERKTFSWGEKKLQKVYQLR